MSDSSSSHYPRSTSEASPESRSAESVESNANENAQVLSEADVVPEVDSDGEPLAGPSKNKDHRVPTKTVTRKRAVSARDALRSDNIKTEFSQLELHAQEQLLRTLNESVAKQRKIEHNRLRRQTERLAVLQI